MCILKIEAQNQEKVDAYEEHSIQKKKHLHKITL